MPRDGTKNLIPLNRRTKEEQKELTRKGGYASGRARRDKRDSRERIALLLQLAMKVNGKNVTSPITGKNMSVGEAIDTAIIGKAVKGDIKAANIIYELLGLKSSKMELTGKDGAALIPVQQMTTEDIKAEIARIRESREK